MLSIQNKLQDINQICRTCLKNGRDLIPIATGNLGKMLKYCNLWPPTDEGSFPKGVCCNCKLQIIKCYEFRLQCVKSYSALVKNRTEIVLEKSKKSEGSPVKVAMKLSCSKCSFQCSTSSIMTQHCREIHKNNNSSCEPQKLVESELETLPEIDCDNSDDIISLLDVSESEGASTKVYTCDKCLKSFSNEADLKVHKSVHENDGLHCLNCLKQFNSRPSLKRHLRTHLVKKPFVCKICNKEFPESYALTKHVRHHAGVAREKKHLCHECGQKFSEPYYLKIHMRRHSGERPYICTVCSKTFADPRIFKMHNLIHEGQKPFRCHICQREFTQSVNLIKHIRTHTGEKPYCCTECDKRFAQSSTLVKHRRTHTGEKPFSCTKCNRNFAEKGNLVKHLRTHSPKTNFNCVECDSNFTLAADFKLHMRKHHSDTKSIVN